MGMKVIFHQQTRIGHFLKCQIHTKVSKPQPQLSICSKSNRADACRLDTKNDSSICVGNTEGGLSYQKNNQWFFKEASCSTSMESSKNLYPRVATLTEGFLRKGKWLNSEGWVPLAREDLQPLSPNDDPSICLSL